MGICSAMRVHSPVEKRYHTKKSYRVLIVFRVVCGDISRSKLVLGTLIQRRKNSNFRLHLQRLSHEMGICRAMRVSTDAERTARWRRWRADATAEHGRVHAVLPWQADRHPALATHAQEEKGGPGVTVA